MNIGSTTRGSGKFTTLDASGNVILSPGSGGSVTISPMGSVTISPMGSVTMSPTVGSVTISPGSGSVTISPGGGQPVTMSPTGSLTLGATGSSATTITSGAVGAMSNIQIGQTKWQAGTFTQVTAYDGYFGNAATTDYRRALVSWSGGDFSIETSAGGAASPG